MKGKPVYFERFVVYPEYCELSFQELQQASHDGNIHVASFADEDYNRCVAFDSGHLVYDRSKYRLHKSEEHRGVQRGTAPSRVVVLGGQRVLILICYELLFPADYWVPSADHCYTGVDTIIHLVGVPMFSEEQREGWVALQQALVRANDCPLVCCCGGPSGRMNISGVVWKLD